MRESAIVRAMQSRALLFLLVAFCCGMAPLWAQSDDTYAKIPEWGDAGENKLQEGDPRGAIEEFQRAFEASAICSANIRRSLLMPTTPTIISDARLRVRGRGRARSRG
jgi:hypothetical protein